ncbi:hypothetical protein OSB04_un001323 [Centaurea solstitialis]|uniref:NADH dehydrogenase subunit 4L n=1 Tax=Centaurea solstitialis TaxID=347529 RepID=A0AA38S491_9ASTR|nr:hypothetical protein OSB04_un001323 [Centaurea solstitialis]
MPDLVRAVIDEETLGSPSYSYMRAAYYDAMLHGHDSWLCQEVFDFLDITRIRGILLNRRNIPIMSMPIESMLLAVNSNFLVFSVSSDDMMGQSFASLVPTVAAAESAIGLAIFVITFRVRGTIAVESINSIQGSGPFSLGERIRF